MLLNNMNILDVMPLLLLGVINKVVCLMNTFSTQNNITFVHVSCYCYQKYSFRLKSFSILLAFPWIL